jgi:hypothetical protein
MAQNGLHLLRGLYSVNAILILTTQLQFMMGCNWRLKPEQSSKLLLILASTVILFCGSRRES